MVGQDLAMRNTKYGIRNQPYEMTMKSF